MILSADQTKFTCSLGHYGCNINHETYNYVKPVYKPNSNSTGVKNSQKPKPTDLQSCNHHVSVFQSSLTRKIDKLQCFYGLPASHRQNTADDLISPEFASIWENLFVFNNQMSEIAYEQIVPKLNANGGLAKTKNLLEYYWKQDPSS